MLTIMMVNTCLLIGAEAAHATSCVHRPHRGRVDQVPTNDIVSTWHGESTLVHGDCALAPHMYSRMQNSQALVSHLRPSESFQPFQVLEHARKDYQWMRVQRLKVPTDRKRGHVVNVLTECIFGQKAAD